MSTNTESTETKSATPAPVKKATKPAKKASSKKATKPAKAKGAKKASGGRRGGPRLAAKFAGKKIKILVKDNPKREGTRSYKAFTAYKNGMPVEKLLEEGKKVGFKSADLAWDIAHKFVALH